MDLVLGFDDDRASLADAGGKGVNLAQLSRAGFDVPPGCIIATTAYARFVAATGLDVLITRLLDDLDTADADATEVVSATVRAAFRDRPLPDDLAAALRSGIAPFTDGPVAVRSSATAEDLPDASFAGQQDTFLDVTGADAVLVAVVECWSSLWTARAISYRAAQRIDHTDAAVAVVVQQMVPADVSGVLFTANPLTGIRTRTVIDAITGLGEALVSGQRTPDHFELDTASGRLVATSNPHTPCLTRDQLVALTRLGQRVQAEYGSPQDLEWALVRGARGRPDRLHLLQARAITSLFDIPQAPGGDDETDGLALWFSFGAFQGVVGPITPLGRSALATVAAGGARLFGARFDAQTLPYLGVAGQRLWLRLDGLLRHPVGRRLAGGFLSIAEPASAAVLTGLRRDPRLARRAGGGRSPRVSTAPVRSVGRFLRRALPRVPQALHDPGGRRAGLDRAVTAYLQGCAARAARAADVTDPLARLGHRVAAARIGLTECLGVLLPQFASVIVPSMIMLAGLRRVARRSADPDAATWVLELLRGLPGNVTTDMDLALWRVAQSLRRDRRAATDEALAGHPEWQGFLHRYGMRGVAEIDLGRPRWRERPDQVISTIATYLTIDDPHQAPDVVYQRAVVTAETAAERLTGLARSAAERARIRFMISRVRGLMGARETPKFTIVQAMGIIRAGLLDSGRDLVDLGLLDDPTDVAFLDLRELELLAGGSRRDWRTLVARRRLADEREQRRRAVPLVLLGDGHAFHASHPTTGDASDADLVGAPVSPGVVEGVVRVVLDPHASGLTPGEILVCPGTDPAWTPLFLIAAGLVTEVGGMMTHGSVVAREYGIPAVVGVPAATTRLVSGQRVRLDGSTGTVTVLEPDLDPAADRLGGSPLV